MKAKSFLITGLPRSRTAWMSVMMTTARSLCLHEPSSTWKDIGELADFYDTDYPSFIGAADSGLGFFLPWIMEHVGPKTLIIERDPGEVTESLYRLGLPRTTYAWLLQKALEPFREHPLVMWVHYDALDNRRIMERIFWHLLEGEVFDEERYRELNRMRVEVDMNKALQHYAQHKINATHFLRDVLGQVRPLDENRHVAVA